MTIRAGESCDQRCHQDRPDLPRPDPAAVRRGVRAAMSALVKYEAAKVALAEAKAVDEVKHIHDVSAAMKAYAIQAKDKQLEIDASEIRIRAERRLGEMIRAQKESVGLATGGEHGGRPKIDGTRAEPSNQRPTLAQAGIDKKLSARSQAIASIPESDFEETLADHREQQQAVTAKTMEKLSKQGKEAQREVKHSGRPNIPSHIREAIGVVQTRIEICAAKGWPRCDKDELKQELKKLVRLVK